MNALLRGFYISKHLGPRWVAFRFSHAIQQKLGAFERRCPRMLWEERPLSTFVSDSQFADPVRFTEHRATGSARFFFSPQDRLGFRPLLVGYDSEVSPVRVADDLISGRFHYFEFHKVQAGFPPQWHRNPFTNAEIAKNQHWSRIGDFGFGDIKLIWEPNRFASAYALVRAWWRTGHEKYPAAFWKLIEDWREHNQLNSGANWKCGQETALRVMAWCFGLFGFLNAPHSTPDRVAMLGAMIAASAERIAAHIDYALSQRNNHGISEAAGLWTVGVLFPEFSKAMEWAETGRKHLENLARDLIYDDGAFAQHSANYHRLMLHDYLWVVRLAELNSCPFSEELKHRLTLAGEFLYQVNDSNSGHTPCFGQNDGALILPLNNCEPQNYKPVIQAIRYLTDGVCEFPAGPWNEDLLWLFGSGFLDSQVHARPKRDFSAPHGGCWTLRAPTGFAFIRCPSFRDRPSQADSLHVDLWSNGVNVALDPGTFSYNAPEPWNNPFSHSRFHNTVTVDGQDQMERVGKFLWLPWLRGNAAFSDPSIFKNPAITGYWQGEHNGYSTRGVTHRRAVLRCKTDVWIVIDRLQGRDVHDYRLHWLLSRTEYEWDGSSRLLLRFAHGDFAVNIGSNALGKATLVVADPASPRGWRAPQYFHREPAISVDLTVHDRSAWFWSIFSPQRTSVKYCSETLSIESGALQFLIALQDSASALLVGAPNC